MKKFKRYFTLILVVMLIFDMISVPVSAATNKNKVKSIEVTNLPGNMLVVKKGKS